jgi:CBS domain-containing protein
MHVKDLMKTELFVLLSEDSISAAQELMSKKNIRHIPIVDENNKLLGLVTHIELIKALVKGLYDVKMKDIMKDSLDTISVGPLTPLKGAIEVMMVNKISCLPVVENNSDRLIGIISEIDLLRALYDMTFMPADFYKIKNK